MSDIDCRDQARETGTLVSGICVVGQDRRDDGGGRGAHTAQLTPKEPSPHRLRFLQRRSVRRPVGTPSTAAEGGCRCSASICWRGARARQAAAFERHVLADTQKDPHWISCYGASELCDRRRSELAKGKRSVRGSLGSPAGTATRFHRSAE